MVAWSRWCSLCALCGSKIKWTRKVAWSRWCSLCGLCGFKIKWTRKMALSGWCCLCGLCSSKIEWIREEAWRGCIVWLLKPTQSCQRTYFVKLGTTSMSRPFHINITGGTWMCFAVISPMLMMSNWPHNFLKIHFVTFGTMVAHECVCGNITHADHAQSADTFRDVRDFLKPSYTQERGMTWGA